MLDFLPYALLLIYAIASLFYLALFIQKMGLLSKITGVILLTLVITHTSTFILHLINHGYIPVSNIFEAISSIALAILLIYFLIEKLSRIKTTGFIFITIAFVLQLIYQVFSKEILNKQTFVKSPLFMWHTGCAITSYAAFVIGAVYGMLYLFLFKNIKTKKFGRFFKRMPSLEELDEMNLKSSTIGLFLLIFAIFFGYLWKQNLYGQAFHFDPKVLLSFLCCLLYLFQVIASLKLRWFGRKRSYLSIGGLVLILLSMIVGNMTTNFHSFL